MSKKLTRKGRPRKSRKVTLSTPMPHNGDHGTGTQAASEGTVVVPIKSSPNRMAYRKRVSALDRLIAAKKLSGPEQQAANAIRDAYARVESLSSGSPLKEQVDASPKPDATIAAQVDAMSEWAHIISVVKRDRQIVEHVCCEGQPIRTLPAKFKRRALIRLRAQLIKVAVHLRYVRAQDVEFLVA